MNTQHSTLLKGMKKEILTTLINNLNDCIVIRSNGKWIVEITKPVSLAIQETIFNYAVSNGISIKEDIKVNINDTGLVVCVYSINMKINGLEYLIVGVGEGLVSEDKDTSARTAETRAHKRALDKLMGHEGNKILIWLGDRIEESIRSLPKEQRDIIFNTSTSQDKVKSQKLLKEVMKNIVTKYRDKLLERVGEL